MRARAPAPVLALLWAAHITGAASLRLEATEAQPQAGAASISASPCTAEVLRRKDLDVVVFGATGFTGGFAAQYLAQHPDAPRWAIAARNAEKLTQLRDKLAVGAKAVPSVIVADLADQASLLGMTSRARVVMNYAGPYEVLGNEALIRAAVEGCAHYTDVTGETGWVAAMMRKYAPAAAARGVALVPSAGYHAIVADLLGLAAAEAVAADGRGPPTEVVVDITKMNTGGLSGASVASGTYDRQHYKPITDPYFLVPEMPVSRQERADTTMLGARALQKARLLGNVSFDYALAEQDCLFMRRTFNRRFPGAPISVAVGLDKGRLEAEHFKFSLDPRIFRHPPKVGLRIGDYPPVWMEEKGSFAAKALGVRSDGAMAHIAMEAPSSPSYKGTGRISAEFALGLAVAGASEAGFVTPSLALAGGARVLVDRMNRSGAMHIWEVKPAVP